jgi:hypothetical protein
VRGATQRGDSSAFEATELIDVFTDLERRLASPEADTKTG